MSFVCSGDTGHSRQCMFCPIFVGISCGHPGSAAYLQMTGEKFFYPEEVVLSCPTGFLLQGDSLLACQASGKWNGSTPHCVPKSCWNDPQLGANVHVATLNASFNGTAVLRCNAGYLGSVLECVSRCTADLVWSPDPLQLTCNGEVNFGMH